MIDYVIAYISLSTLDYHSVWWKLLHAPDATTTWSSALILVELLFSLPASNGSIFVSQYNQDKQALSTQQLLFG